MSGRGNLDAVVERVPLSIVIPLYRDEDALVPIFERCGPVLDAAGGGELVLVDDGGLDATTPRAIELGEAFRHPVAVVELARNFGQHPAVFAGLAAARGEVVVTLDSDLQYPPEEIEKLTRVLSAEHRVVSGYRAERRDPPARRLITRLLTAWLNARTGSSLKDFGSMFRAYDRQTVDLMLRFTERHRYVPAVVAWLGVSVEEVPVRHDPRGPQGSRYRLNALVEMVFDLVTGYSVAPMRFVTLLGLGGAVAGTLGTLVFAAYRVLIGESISGTTSAFALLFALLALVLAILAVLGEYVGRIYTESKGRPYYLVRGSTRVGGAPVPDPPDDPHGGSDPGSGP